MPIQSFATRWRRINYWRRCSSFLKRCYSQIEVQRLDHSKIGWRRVKQRAHLRSVSQETRPSENHCSSQMWPCHVPVMLQPIRVSESQRCKERFCRLINLEKWLRKLPFLQCVDQRQGQRSNKAVGEWIGIRISLKSRGHYLQTCLQVMKRRKAWYILNIISESKWSETTIN